jgi:hypothetical protein
MLAAELRVVRRPNSKRGRCFATNAAATAATAGASPNRPLRASQQREAGRLLSAEGDIHLSQVLLAWAALCRRQGRWTVGTRATRPGFDAVTGRRPVGRVLTTRLR